MSTTKGKSKRGRRPVDREQQSDSNRDMAEKEDENRNSEDHDGKASSLAEDDDQTTNHPDNDSDSLDNQQQRKSDGGKKWSPPRYNQSILEYMKESRKPTSISMRPSRRYAGKSNVLSRIRGSQDQKREMWPHGNRPNSLSPILGMKDIDPAFGDLLPEDVSFLSEGADTISSDVAVRILKARVTVLQEELHHLIQESIDKDERTKQLEDILKEVEMERARLQKDLNIKQMQVDKYQRMADDARNKMEDYETQCISLRKEVEILRHGQKQAVAIKGTAESRLNRTLEEMDRLRSELRQARQETKEYAESERKKVEELLVENRQLEKQKAELLTAFKKQMKLIDVLKKQKMHLEAAKALNFTEEEFMRALDWGS